MPNLESILMNPTEKFKKHPPLKTILDQGFAFLDKAQFEPARKLFEQVLRYEPYHFDAIHMLGTIALQLGEWGKALNYFDQAIAINPRFTDVHSNRSAVLSELGRFDEALSSANQAIALKPDNAGAYNNRGMALRSLCLLDEAIESCERAIALDPDFVQARFNLSIFLLLAGYFARGWEEYEWRWKNPSFPEKQYPFHQPRWLGHQSLRGKMLLLQSEQGFGDTLQMCRYLPQVQALGATIVMDVATPLQSLLVQLPGVTQWVKMGDTFPDFDYYCPLMSLPLAFETRLETIPATIPYLRADTAKVAHWKAKLEARFGVKTKQRIGLVWSGSTTHLNDHNRSLMLKEWLPYLPDHLEYICLQKEIRDTDKADISSLQGRQQGIQYFCDDIVDFSDTAALCELMDVVISVDTSVAHLAGALGKPLWVLLPFVPDWRWLLDRRDSPWYPTATLYRQPQPHDWKSVFLQVEADLKSLSFLPKKTGWLQRLQQLW